jgi:mannose-6-phosphate isomerase
MPHAAPLHPLVFVPLYRDYLWGGRRFEGLFGRELRKGGVIAESWELVDRGGDQSIVAAGPLAGTPLGELVRTRRGDLLGDAEAAGPFPLLFKFLDAHLDLSVQVHPDDARAAKLVPPDRGKTEAWYVVAAEPGSLIHAGLVPGTTREHLRRAIEQGRAAEVLANFEPQAGDCVFIPAGTVHAIGAGVVVAEIQQSSDVTYRLFDWNRVGPDGRPRALHVEAGIDAVTSFTPVRPVEPLETPDPSVRRLVACEHFRLDEVRPGTRWATVGGRLGFLAVIRGGIRLAIHWGLPALGPGRCVLLPAALGPERIECEPGTVLLAISLPDR